MAEIPKKYSQEAWKEITNVSCVDVALALGYEIDEKRSDSKAFHMADSGGLYVWKNGQGYYRHSTETKGNAVKLVQEERGCSYVQALDYINENVLGNRFYEPEKYKSYTNNSGKLDDKNKEMVLPEFTKANRVFAYLAQTRGIDPEIISELLKNGSIRQQAEFGNCCFLGFDPQGKARYCSVRGTGSKQYRGEIENSDKNYGFFIKGKSNVLKVFESPIEAMSHATFAKMTGRDWREDTRLSLGGTAERALIQHLKDYPNQYDEIWFCLNDDYEATRKDYKTGQQVLHNAGQIAAEKFAEKYGKDYKVKIKLPFSKDYNDDLIAVKSFMQQNNCDVTAALDYYTNQQEENGVYEDCEDYEGWETE